MGERQISRVCERMGDFLRAETWFSLRGMEAYRGIQHGCTMFAPIQMWSCGLASMEDLTARVSRALKSGLSFRLGSG